MREWYFCDTEALIARPDLLISNPNPIVVSSISVAELTAWKYSGQVVLDLIRELYKPQTPFRIIYPYNPDMFTELTKVKELQESNEHRILAAAYHYDKTQHPDATVFITGSPELAETANLFFGEDSIILV